VIGSATPVVEARRELSRKSQLEMPGAEIVAVAGVRVGARAEALIP
jgi:hypothetical protein